MKTIVIGLGNPILSDDGVGVRVAWELETAVQQYPLPPDHQLTITEASVGGLRLMELMDGYDRAILIDAWQPPSVVPPGQVHRLTLADLRGLSPTQHSASAHDTTLITALAAGQALGLSLPAEIVIYAITVAQVMDFGEQMTSAVATAVPMTVTAVLQELTQLVP